MLGSILSSGLSFSGKLHVLVDLFFSFRSLTLVDLSTSSVEPFSRLTMNDNAAVERELLHYLDALKMAALGGECMQCSGLLSTLFFPPFAPLDLMLDSPDSSNYWHIELEWAWNRLCAFARHCGLLKQPITKSLDRGELRCRLCGDDAVSTAEVRVVEVQRSE